MRQPPLHCGRFNATRPPRFRLYEAHGVPCIRPNAVPLSFLTCLATVNAQYSQNASCASLTGGRRGDGATSSRQPSAAASPLSARDKGQHRLPLRRRPVELRAVAVTAALSRVQLPPAHRRHAWTLDVEKSGEPWPP